MTLVEEDTTDTLSETAQTTIVHGAQKINKLSMSTQEEYYFPAFVLNHIQH